MSRSPTVWWNKQKFAWCTDTNGRRQVLAEGRSNRQAAVARLKSLAICAADAVAGLLLQSRPSERA